MFGGRKRRSRGGVIPGYMPVPIGREGVMTPGRYVWVGLDISSIHARKMCAWINRGVLK